MCYSAMYGGRSGRAKGKAPKGKKSKCSLCDAKGHLAADCPDRDEMVKKLALKTPLGFGHTHKTSRKASASRNGNSQEQPTAGGGGEGGLVSLMEEIFPQEQVDLDPFYFFDAGCDVAASLDSLATVYGSGKKGKAALTAALLAAADDDDTHHNVMNYYGGCICRVLLKPGDNCNWDPVTPQPRTAMVLEADPLAFFVLGLGPGFLPTSGYTGTAAPQERSDNDNSSSSSDEEEAVEDVPGERCSRSGGTAVASAEEDDDYDVSGKRMAHAVHALTAAAAADPGRVVGFYAKLDYAPDTVQLPGYDAAAQLHRLRATCRAAIRARVPVQCRIAPGAPAAANDGGGGAGGGDSVDDSSAAAAAAAAYVQVVKDLAKVLVDMTPPPSEDETAPTLRVHLASWNGTEAHVMHLCKAFPDTVYVGMNATVGFAKQKVAQECAFAVPLNRLVLETDAPLAIPAPVVAALGRKAFCHSGCIPFVAAAVAAQKRQVSAVEVARAAAENTVRLYGRGMAERAAHAAVEAAARAEQKRVRRLEEEHLQAADAAAGAVDDDADGELAAQQLLEEMAAMMAAEER